MQHSVKETLPSEREILADFLASPAWPILCKLALNEAKPLKRSLLSGFDIPQGERIHLQGKMRGIFTLLKRVSKEGGKDELPPAVAQYFEGD